MDHESTIQHISDTSLWIAAFRAQETERKDAAFKDPLAKKLAGDRGFRMVAETPHKEAMAFAMVVRTAAIDQLVLSAISKGMERVINLAAGLDTRPYRLKLPPGLSWIEIDLPEVISYKEKILQDDVPTCNLQRLATDLTNDNERKQLFHDLSVQGGPALVITEGLIEYLTQDQARKLSNDLYAIASFKYWIMDYSQGKLRNRKQTKDLQKMIRQTPLQFRCADPLSFFAQTGWRVAENHFILDEAARIGRKLPAMFPWTLLMKIFPRKIRKMANETYGYVMLGKENP